MERAGVGFERARGDRGGGGAGHVHRPAHRDRHRARAGGRGGLALRPVSSLAALAEGIDAELRLPLIDARRGELFAALYDAGRRASGSRSWRRRSAVAERARKAGPGLRAAGRRVDTISGGARGGRDRASMRDESRSHVVRALHVCRLAQTVPGEPPETVLPDYLRAPDAKPREPGPPDPPPHLRRPATGDRDRAARVPDALVAGDVRARAVQAVGDLPGRDDRRADRGLPGLLALRHRLARHERGRGRPAARARGSPPR